MSDLNFSEPWLPVLDQGFVRLIDSMPAEHGAGDRRIVQAARVSYSSGTTQKRSDEGLIRYLIKNQHTTPLEKVVFEFHVALPMSVARQWQRHRTQSYNEVSTRYSEVDDGRIYVPDINRFRAQDNKNRQGSSAPLTMSTQEACFLIMRTASRVAYASYKDLLEHGLAREIARGVLPIDTYTEFYTTVNLHNLMNFLTLRLDPGAQWEIQQYARALLKLARPIAPIAFGIWEKIREERQNG